MSFSLHENSIYILLGEILTSARKNRRQVIRRPKLSSYYANVKYEHDVICHRNTFPLSRLIITTKMAHSCKVPRFHFWEHQHEKWRFTRISTRFFHSYLRLLDRQPTTNNLTKRRDSRKPSSSLKSETKLLYYIVANRTTPAKNTYETICRKYLSILRGSRFEEKESRVTWKSCTNNDTKMVLKVMHSWLRLEKYLLQKLQIVTTLRYNPPPYWCTLASGAEKLGFHLAFRSY